MHAVLRRAPRNPCVRRVQTVLQVIPELDAGGAERTTVDVAAAVVEAGGTALVASQGGRLAAELEAVGAELITAPMASKNPIVIAMNAVRLGSIIRSRDVDIVHARSRAPAWSALWAARASGRVFVTTYHGTYTARSGLKRWYNSVMARGDAVIANSAFIGAHIAAEHPRAIGKITVIPRGVDTQTFDPAAVTPDRVAALRDAWGLSAEAPGLVALMPGRLTRWKGQAIAVEAVRLLTERGRSVRLVMPGDDQGRTEYRAEIEAAVEAAGLTDRVIVPGHCEDMAAAYALSDVVISASVEPEAFGRVAAEGQCMARPVIATDHGGARETVAPGATGLLIPPGDSDALADGLERIAALSPSERLAMGERGAARARALFSVETMQAATLGVYDAAMDTRAWRRGDE